MANRVSVVCLFPRQSTKEEPDPVQEAKELEEMLASWERRKVWLMRWSRGY